MSASYPFAEPAALEVRVYHGPGYYDIIGRGVTSVQAEALVAFQAARGRSASVHSDLTPVNRPDPVLAGLDGGG